MSRQLFAAVWEIAPRRGLKNERVRSPDERELGNAGCRSGGFDLNARLWATRAIKDMLDEPTSPSAGGWGSS